MFWASLIILDLCNHTMFLRPSCLQMKGEGLYSHMPVENSVSITGPNKVGSLTPLPPEYRDISSLDINKPKTMDKVQNTRQTYCTRASAESFKIHI